MKKICVFLSGSNAPAKFAEAAKKFARLMVQHGYGLVWGGSDLGLMNIVATTVQEEGGHLCGITIKLFNGSSKPDADEMIIAPNLSERKDLMLEKSDAIAVIAGGIGTSDELTEALELKKQGAHHKPIVFLNTDNFFEGLILWFERMEREGFLPMKIADLAYFADTPEEAIAYIEHELAGISQNERIATPEKESR